MSQNALLCRLLLAVIFISAHGVASAQATRTWVSGVGDDANPCSRTAPCKTFAGAISKTAAGGEISVLDPGGFGAVTITKAITIDGAGTLASILNSFSNGVVVNAGVNDKVVLRNLTINGAGTGLNGIRFLAGASLTVDKVRITGNASASPNGIGISFLPSGTSRLVIVNSVIANNGNGGVLVAPGASGSAWVSVSHSQLIGNDGYGLRAQDRSLVAVSHSNAAANGFQGILGISTSQYVDITVTNCVLTDNGNGPLNAGAIQSNGAASIIRIAQNTITNNQYGLWAPTGRILSFGSNYVTDNDTDGVPTGTLTTR